ncbi:MAG: hypothetical protein V3V31_11490 [Methylococcales bacterium]
MPSINKPAKEAKRVLKTSTRVVDLLPYGLTHIDYTGLERVDDVRVKASEFIERNTGVLDPVQFKNILRFRKKNGLSDSGGAFARNGRLYIKPKEFWRWFDSGDDQKQ